MIRHLADIVQSARSQGVRKLIVAYGQDCHTIEAVNDAVEAGLVAPTIFGNPAEIERICNEKGIDPSRFTVIPENNDTKCVERAVRMISEGEGDLLMKGLVSTDKYMHAILSKEYGLVPPKGVLSHVATLEIPGYHKLLLVSDVAVIPYPDFKQKCQMVRYLISTARALGIEKPKIACIAPSEQLLPNVTSSVEAALIAKMGERGQLGSNILIDGPLALDVAIDEETAITKRLSSPVAGDADCLLFPNIDAGNVFFKSCTKLCKANLAGVVTGTKVPCVLTSRGDTRETKLYSIALACCLSTNK